MVIGVDLGGTKVLAGAVDAQLGVHHRAYRLAAGASRPAVLETVIEAVQEAADAVDEPIEAVGFGIPSLIDQERGVAVTTVHLPITDVPFRALMAERLGLPVALDNDANCALLAEHRFGAAAGTRNAVLVTIGTGVGGAIVVDGRLVRGATGAAGELGHMVVDLDGEPCHGNCPNRGCLETVVSGTALARYAREDAAASPLGRLGRAAAAGRELTGALVTEFAHDGDAGATACLTRAGEGLGVGLSSLTNVFNPEVVVVGGGVIAAGDLLLDPARRVLAARALAPNNAVPVVPARFGAEAGMLGAAVLAMDTAAGRR